MFQKILENWYLLEPALFQVAISHTFVEDTTMKPAFRVGKMNIYYNPKKITSWTEEQIKERLKLECIRILLGHPYMRQPYNVDKGALYLGSDITLRDNYGKCPTLPDFPLDLKWKKGQTFEDYYLIAKQYMESLPPSNHWDYESQENTDEEATNESEEKDSQEEKDKFQIEGSETEQSEEITDEESSEGRESEGNEQNDILEEYAQAAQEWDEDQLALEQVKEIISNAQNNKTWGSISGDLVDKLLATLIVKIDYRRVLSMFRSSVLSSKRHLTRMRPSRRYGFEYMGSKRDFTTRILVAVDVSSSVEDKEINMALSIVNRFLKYGIETIDVIMFDTEIVGEKTTLKKAQKTWNVYGRGGTDFNAAIEYYLKEEYDGLIMITDGCAPEPQLPERFIGRILFMIFNGNMDLIDKIDNPRITYLELPK